MPILADYHMHTPRCKHAAGPMAAYVERGIALGLEEIGFSDHNPLPHGLGANVRMDEAELDDYVADVLRLQAQYRDQIRVRLGLEMDYVEGLEPYLAAQRRRYPWDYVIGSIHYLDPECQTIPWDRHLAVDFHPVYERYYALLRKLAQTGLYDIVAHFDVPKRSGRPATARATEAVTQTLVAIASAGMCLEINTSGLRHTELAHQPEGYPAWGIVTEALALKIPLTVNSDAHAPDQVGAGFAEVAAGLHAAGCRTLARFAAGKREAYIL